jgi:hypothetical protein
MAALMWFVVGPLLVFALFVPVALLLPVDAEGRVQISDALAGCGTPNSWDARAR